MYVFVLHITYYNIYTILLYRLFLLVNVIVLLRREFLPQDIPYGTSMYAEKIRYIFSNSPSRTSKLIDTIPSITLDESN